MGSFVYIMYLLPLFVNVKFLSPQTCTLLMMVLKSNSHTILDTVHDETPKNPAP
jgi:hypothetical protein